MPEPAMDEKLARRRARGALDVSRAARIFEGPASGEPEAATGPVKLSRTPRGHRPGAGARSS